MQSKSLEPLRAALRDLFQRVAGGDDPILITWKGETLLRVEPESAKALASSLGLEAETAATPVEPEAASAPAEPPRQAEPEPKPEPKPEPAAATSSQEERDDEIRPRRRRRRRRRRVESEEQPATEAPASETPSPAPPARALPPTPPPTEPLTPERLGTLAPQAEEELTLSRTAEETIKAIPQHPVEMTEHSFASFGLSQPILHSLREIGFEHPTPIQAAVLPAALEGGDVIGLAQTGSGKTAAFCLPLAERLFHGRGVRGLILSPTREIAMQTKAFLDLFGRDHQLKTVCLIGGVPMGPQITGLKREPDILVATPGRLLDHVRRRNVRLDKIEELVLDEADHMLDLGFLPQIADVLRYLPEDRRTMMFSATMPPDIERLAQRMMTDPVRVDIMPQGAAEGISHRLYLVSSEEEKKKCVLALLHQELGSTLVFIRRKVDAEWLTRVLEREGHPVERIHSDLSQKQRVRALKSFREGQHRILVATDIAARGLDVPRIQHVINFDLPDQIEDYIHRAGRTARGTLRGTVSSICTWKDKMMVREIESALGEEIPRCTVPGVEAFVERKTAAKGRGRHKLPTRRRL